MARRKLVEGRAREELLAALKAGATDMAASEAAGVDRDTFYREMKRDAAFAAEVQRARGGGRLWHELNWRKAAEGDWRASLEWLARRYPEDWSAKQRVEFVHVVASLADEMGLSDEEKAAAVAEAERITKEKGRAHASR